MATDVERLILQMSADVRGLERAMQRAQTGANRAMSNIERRNTQMNARMSREFAALGANMARAFTAAAVAFATREVTRMADTWINLSNQLRQYQDVLGETASAQERLTKLALDSRTNLESLGVVTGGVARAARELGASSDETFQAIEAISKGAAIANTGIAGVDGAMRQLAQAMASPRVQLEEFNSIIEGTPRLAQGLADGIEEAGGSIAKLRELIAAGEVSGRDFFQAFLTQLPKFREEFATTASTSAQAMTNLRTALTAAIGNLDEATASTANLTLAMNELAEGIAKTFTPASLRNMAAVNEELKDMFVRTLALTASFGNLALAEQQVFAARARRAAIEQERALPQTLASMSGLSRQAAERAFAAPAPARPAIATGAGGGDVERSMRNMERVSSAIAVQARDATAALTEGQDAIEAQTAEFEKQLPIMQQEHALGLAYIADNKALIEQLERQAYIRAKTAEMMERLHISEQTAVSLATAYADELERARDAATAIDLTDIVQRFEQEARLQDRFADWFVQGARIAADGDMKDIFEFMLEGAFNRAARNTADALFDLMNSAFPSNAGGGINWVSLLTSVFGGLQHGGPISAGQTRMVGERGPELFTARTSGYVMPNGPRPIVVNAPDNRVITITGASSAELLQLRRMLAQDRASRVAQTRAIVGDMAQRGRLG